MKVHVRFKQGLDAYPKGTSHYLPDELADHYIRAGVADLVDVVPRPAVEPEKKSPPVDDSAKQESSTADESKADKSEADDGSTTKTTSSKRRSKS